MEKKKKHIFISAEYHQIAKIQAAKADKNLKTYIESLILENYDQQNPEEKI